MLGIVDTIIHYQHVYVSVHECVNVCERETDTETELL